MLPRAKTLKIHKSLVLRNEGPETHGPFQYIFHAAPQLEPESTQRTVCMSRITYPMWTCIETQ